METEMTDSSECFKSLWLWLQRESVLTTGVWLNLLWLLLLLCNHARASGGYWLAVSLCHIWAQWVVSRDCLRPCSHLSCLLLNFKRWLELAWKPLGRGDCYHKLVCDAHIITYMYIYIPATRFSLWLLGERCISDSWEHWPTYIHHIYTYIYP